MNKLAVGLLVLLAGWGLGWYTHSHWSDTPIQSIQTVTPVPADYFKSEKLAEDFVPVTPGRGDNLADLLKHSDFEAVVERYESLRVQSNEVAMAEARTRILVYARRLIANRQFSLAEQLLQNFLAAAHRDAEARILLAEAYHDQGDFRAAIDQLYEARGYAYRPEMLQRITSRIRAVVFELAQSLKRNKDQNALLALYQHLTQLEPDYAPYFMELATTQLVLDDKESARRSLLLVSQDPDVGAQAQVMLSELDLALAEQQNAEPQASATEIIGIPLYRSGSHYIVDAKPSDSRNIRLLIDTGASLTIFTPEALELNGIRYQDTGRTGAFNTANGSVRAPIYTLDALTVGNWQVSQLEFGVLDLGGRSGVDGLLGMNFLRQFRFFIDQDEAVLHLSAGL